MKKMLANVFEFAMFAIDMNLLERRCANQVPKKGEPNHMIEMRMGKEYVQFRAMKQMIQTEDTCPRIQENVGFFKKEGRGVPRRTGMVAGRT
jgi:hypothetical protein